MKPEYKSEDDGTVTVYRPVDHEQVPQMDWQQVLISGGEPCFAVCDDEEGWFCGRPKFADCHDGEHEFVSLTAALKSAEARGREQTWKDAITAVRAVQEGYATNGGRSHRDREQARRQALFIAGVDACRGALESAAAAIRALTPPEEMK